jgi:hypothetical protein
MQSRGYQVTRIPAYRIGSTHFTYTNMVIFNNVVLLPQYNNGPGAAVSNQVLADVQAAFGPGKTVYQINGDAIVPSAGVFHCIVQHVPIHKGLIGVNGGLAPTAYLRGPNSGQSFLAGQQYNLEWISDDDAPLAAQGGVQNVDIVLSTDGGQTFPITIATNQPPMGSFLWTIPNGINTTQARVRVVARDGLNNAGGDESDTNFSITDIAPAVANSTFVYQTAPQRLTFVFTQDVSTSLSLDDVLVEDLTHGGNVTPDGLSYNVNTNTATVTFTGILSNANYRATLDAAGITNSGGTPMGQDHVFNFFFMQGDADHNGVVDFDDYVLIDNGFNNQLTGFANGDFNYDGVVDFDDYVIIDLAFNSQ